MLTYALGRGVEPYDRPAVDGIVGATKAGDYKFSTLVLGIVHSDPFQKRRGRNKSLSGNRSAGVPPAESGRDGRAPVSSGIIPKE